MRFLLKENIKFRIEDSLYEGFCVYDDSYKVY